MKYILKNIYMPEKIFIRKAKISDADEIAQLHIENINKGFLTKLGDKFLVGIYKFIIIGPESFCFVAVIDKKIVGFISATENCQLLYKRFFSKNFYLGFKVIIIKIFDLSVIRKSIDHLFLPKKRQVLPKAEFLTIAVDNKIKRKGLGTQLFERMRREFRKRKTEGFIAIVGQSLKPSNRFMDKMKAIKISEIQVHKGEISNVYFWK